MKIMVTGGAGFIGSHLCDRLLSLGHDVICVDNFDNFYPKRFKQQNIENALKNPNFYFYETDITNYEKIAPIFELHQIDVIVHLAGRGGVTPSVDRPLFYVHTNVHGTLCMLEAARHYHILQFIFASSSSVYGPDSKPPFSENETCVVQPSPYGTTKRAAELFIRTYHDLYGIHATILRFFTAYGPRSRPDMAIYSKFTEKIVAGEPLIEYHGMKRDFTYIDDVVSGIVSAINKNLDFEIINLGNSDPVPVRKYIQAIEKSLGIKAEIKVKDARPGELLVTMADISKAKRLLGYDPKTKVETGVANFVKWYKKYRQGNELRLRKNKPTAVILFDFDGVIINVEREKSNIFGELVEKYWKGDKKNAATFYYEISGPARKFKFDFYYRKLFNKKLLNEEYQLIEDEFSQRLYKELYSKTKPAAAVIKLLRFARSHFDYSFICSGVPMKEIGEIAEKCGVSKYFNKVLGSDGRYPSKSSMFEEILTEKKPEICIFITDSWLDIKAARESGITTIGIPSNQSEQKLKSAEADFVCSLNSCEKIIEDIIFTC